MDIKEVAKWLRGEQAVYEEAREYNRKHENRQSMLRANAQAEEMSAMAEACERFTWRPIETAPKDGTYFLAVVGGDVVMTRWDENPEVDDEPGWLDMCGPDPTYECFRPYHGDEHPTHWMPLPEAPL